MRQILLKRAAKAGLKGTLAEPFSPHGLRAGFVTTAYRNGVPDEEIMGLNGTMLCKQPDLWLCHTDKVVCNSTGKFLNSVCQEEQ